MIRADQCAEHDQFFLGTLSAVRACADVALTQGPLSKRNALMEIQKMVETALTPPRGHGESPPREG